MTVEEDLRRRLELIKENATKALEALADPTLSFNDKGIPAEVFRCLMGIYRDWEHIIARIRVRRIKG